MIPSCRLMGLAHLRYRRDSSSRFPSFSSSCSEIVAMLVSGRRRDRDSDLRFLSALKCKRGPLPRTCAAARLGGSTVASACRAASDSEQRAAEQWTVDPPSVCCNRHTGDSCYPPTFKNASELPIFVERKTKAHTATTRTAPAPHDETARTQQRHQQMMIMMAPMRVLAGICVSLVILEPHAVDSFRPSMSMSGGKH